MRNYEILLMARSEKQIPIRAEDAESARNLALELYHYGDSIHFENEDVTEVEAILAERFGRYVRTAICGWH